MKPKTLAWAVLIVILICIVIFLIITMIDGLSSAEFSRWWDSSITNLTIGDLILIIVFAHIILGKH